MSLRLLIAHLGMGLSSYLEQRKLAAEDDRSDQGSVEARLERLERWREHNEPSESDGGRPCACDSCSGWVSFRYGKPEGEDAYRYFDDGVELCNRCEERGCGVPRA